MKKGLLIGSLSFVAGAYALAYGLISIGKSKDSKVLFEDEKIKMTEMVTLRNGSSSMAYIQMKDKK